MRFPFALIAAILLAVFPIPPLHADDAVADARAAPPSTSAAPQACPMSSGQRIDTAQVSQTDCCKGHKGICGCRAGKIVCCDNSISPTCTCHSDWSEVN